MNNMNRNGTIIAGGLLCWRKKVCLLPFNSQWGIWRCWYFVRAQRAALLSLWCSCRAANMHPPGCGSRHYLNTRCCCGLLHGCSAGRPGKYIIDSVWGMQSKARNRFDLSQKMCCSRSEAATWARHWEARAPNFPVITAAFNLFFLG